MRHLKVKRVIIASLIPIAAIADSFQPRSSAQKPDPAPADEQKLLDVAARREGIDVGRLEVLNGATVELPLTGRRVKVAKVVDRSDGKVFGASVDEQGQEVEFSTLKS